MTQDLPLEELFRAMLEKALADLPPLQQQILGFRLEEGLEIRDASQVLGISPFVAWQEFRDVTTVIESIAGKVVEACGAEALSEVPEPYRTLLIRKKGHVENKPDSSKIGPVAKALDTVSERGRLLVSLRFYEELTLSEVGTILSIDRSAVLDELEEALGDLAAACTNEDLATRLRWLYDVVPRPLISPAVLTEVVSRVRELTPGLITHLRTRSDDLQRLDPELFEHLVGEFLAQRGFEDVHMVGRNVETSADILAVKHVSEIDSSLRFFVEVKRRKDRVGVEVINQVHGAMVIEQPTFGWNAAMIVSLGGFAEFKKEAVRKVVNRTVFLKDRDDLLLWLSEYKPTDSGLWLPSRSAATLADVIEEGMQPS